MVQQSRFECVRIDAPSTRRPSDPAKFEAFFAIKSCTKRTRAGPLSAYETTVDRVISVQRVRRTAFAHRTASPQYGRRTLGKPNRARAEGLRIATTLSRIALNARPARRRRDLAHPRRRANDRRRIRGSSPSLRGRALSPRPLLAASSRSRRLVKQVSSEGRLLDDGRRTAMFPSA